MRLDALYHLYETCPRRAVSCQEPIVVFSDLHMGNGSRNDGFRHNGPQRPGLWVHSDHLPVVAEIDWPHDG